MSFKDAVCSRLQEFKAEFDTRIFKSSPDNGALPRELLRFFDEKWRFAAAVKWSQSSNIPNEIGPGHVLVGNEPGFRVNIWLTEITSDNFVINFNLEDQRGDE